MEIKNFYILCGTVGLFLITYFILHPKNMIPYVIFALVVSLSVYGVLAEIFPIPRLTLYSKMLDVIRYKGTASQYLRIRAICTLEAMANAQAIEDEFRASFNEKGKEGG